MNQNIAILKQQMNNKVIKLAVIEINKENLEAELLKSKLPVVLDFWGPKCGQCIALMPKYHELAGNPKYDGKFKFCSVDTSKNRRVAISLKVMTQPTFLFYRDGKEEARISGNSTTIEAIASKIEELIHH